MKEAGTAHWSPPNDGSTNSTGFTALTGGERVSNNGEFIGLSGSGRWWTSKSVNATEAMDYMMVQNDNGLYYYQNSKIYGMSVRCVLQQ